jgi:hypothetical protein
MIERPHPHSFSASSAFGTFSKRRRKKEMEFVLKEAELINKFSICNNTSDSK